jgi:hypothetical protein
MQNIVQQKGGNNKAATSSSKAELKRPLHQSWSKVVDSDVLKMTDRQREEQIVEKPPVSAFLPSFATQHS